MKSCKLSKLLPVAFAIVSSLALTGRAQTQSPAVLLDRPDPREIPLPVIKTNLPSLPGVDQLPVRKEMPDPLVMNDGTKVTTPEQMKARQKEIREVLEYYHVGRMPPPPGNVKGTEVKSEIVMDGKVKYRLIHLTFGPEGKLSLDVGIFTPVSDKPVPAVLSFGGRAPGAAELPSVGQGATAGGGIDILLPDEIGIAERAARQAATGGGRGAAGGRGGRGGFAGRGGPGGPGGPAGAGGAPGAAVAGGDVPAGGAPGAPAARGRGGFGGRGGGANLSFHDQVEQAARRNAVVLDHGFGYVNIDTNACAEDSTKREPDGTFSFRTTRFFPAYPGYDWGIIGGWAWGAMRIVDYLQNDPLIDKTKLIITGVSRNGKAAMIAGSSDDRIAMVAPGASSGLGTPAYRFSGGATQTQPSRGGKEGLTLMVMKYGNQFSPNLHQFWGQVDKLPYDAHWFPALTAPRPFIMLEGTQDQNVVHNGIKQTYLAAQPAYALFGAKDKLGMYWSNRPHGFGANDWEGLLAFADKHLLGKNVPQAFDLLPADTEATAND
jgi:hypothetical protein